MGKQRGYWLAATAAVVLASAACAGADNPTTGQGVPGTAATPSVSATATPSTSPRSTYPPTTGPPKGAPSDMTSVVPDEPDLGTSPESGAESDAPTEPRSGGAALAPFFAAVVQTDQNLKAAAEVVNGAIRDGTITIDRATIEAIDRGSPFAVAATIPAGLDPSVEQAVLLVYCDLVSRYGAMRGGDCVEVGTRPLADLNADCFVRGHEPANRTPGDVDAVYAAAAVAPANAVPDPASRESAEVLLRIEYINKANMGCGTMGSYLAMQPIPVDWVTEDSGTPEVPPTDGRVAGIRFTASYDPGSGWTVNLRAC